MSKAAVPPPPLGFGRVEPTTKFSAKVKAVAEATLRRQDDAQRRLQGEKRRGGDDRERGHPPRDEPRAYRFKPRTLAQATASLLNTSETPPPPLELLHSEASRAQTIEELLAKSTAAPPAQEQPPQISPLQPHTLQTTVCGSQSLQQTTQTPQPTSQPPSLQSKPASSALQSIGICIAQSKGQTDVSSAKQLSASNAYSTSPSLGEPNSEQQSQRTPGTSTPSGSRHSRTPTTTSVTSRSIQISSSPSTPLPTEHQLEGWFSEILVVNSRNSKHGQKSQPSRHFRKRKAEYLRILQAELERAQAADTDASSDDGK